MQERVVCSISAAGKYEVPANIVLAVAEKEGGRPGQWVRNTNGTDDVGALQFNTGYLRGLGQYGITAQHVAAAGCYPYDLAAWRLRMHIKNDTGDIWTRAANYHSRTSRFNSTYRVDLIRRALKWADWLEARFPTHDVLASAMPPRFARSTSATVAVLPEKTRHTASPTSPTVPTSSYVPRKLLISGQP
ncbi:hypothetical protein GCM10008020_39190 [Massilia psychrophila]|nr:hypothetical protein GCM10008020_39190 [Massilia psychrophila]